ncbi:MAG: Stp1/IreP family PP2C-type Ser/Thr phosphatase [Prevotellaceae bacterium]|jgi:protein phosphatase|nr:Stp1/IreP family PP2C-type Ser/Thr phosphatase [Prevotellaceae bacterium]
MGLKIDFIADKSLCSNVGLVRKANEDNCGFAQTPNGNLFVVCDGMGGHAGGQVASKIAVDNIMSHLKEKKYADVKQALCDVMQRSNLQILGMAKENPELKGMGTTACILLIQGDEVWIAHAGDSRIYLYVDKEKFLHRITKDHSFVQGLVDSGQIRDEEAENHPQKNIILKALGIKDEVKPTVCNKPVLPAKNDVFLICSDGLSGMIDDTTMESVLRKDVSLADKVNELTELALQNGGKDNITVQLIQIIESPHGNTELNGNEYTPAWRIVQSSVATPKPNKLLKITIMAAVAAIAAVAVVVVFIFLYRKLKTNEYDKNFYKRYEIDAAIIGQKADTASTGTSLRAATTTKDEYNNIYTISCQKLDSLKIKRGYFETKLEELRKHTFLHNRDSILISKLTQQNKKK